MRPLVFNYTQINEAEAKPVNERKKIANELKITENLAPYLEKLNDENSYVLVTISENGEQFHNEIIGLKSKTRYIPFLKS